MTQDEVIREFCRLQALVYQAHDDYTYAADCFCGEGPHCGTSDYRNDGKVIDYIRAAVVERLVKDGLAIPKGFDPVTGRELERTGESRTEPGGG